MQNTGFQFQKATKHKAKLRMAIFGPSGAGKTFSALRIASGMGQRIAVVDTEFGSASKYADRFSFDVCELTEPTIQNYINLIQQAGPMYDVLILDSLSHGWQELLEMIDQLAKTKFKGNSWAAWSEGTPLQRDFVRTIQLCPCHIIATMRSKTEWTTQQDNNGRSRPARVGLAPEQGKGIEYEFDMLLEMNTEHMCTVIKDRTSKFQDQIFEKPSEEFGQALVTWLNEGAEMPPMQYQPPQQQYQQFQPEYQQPVPEQPTFQSQPSFPQPGERFQKPNYTNTGSGGYAQGNPNYPQQQPTGQAAQSQQNRQTPQQYPEIPQASLNILNAVADYFRQKAVQETPGMAVNPQRLFTVVYNRYGRWPTAQAGANKIKQEVQLSEITEPLQRQGAA